MYVGKKWAKCSLIEETFRGRRGGVRNKCLKCCNVGLTEMNWNASCLNLGEIVIISSSAFTGAYKVNVDSKLEGKTIIPETQFHQW